MGFVTSVGFLIASGVFAFAIYLSSKDLTVFLDLPAALIVFGGTAAAALVCFSLPRLLSLLRVFFRRMIGKSRRDYLRLVDEISYLAQAYHAGTPAYEAAIGKVSDPFLKDAASILFWLEAEIPPEHLRDLLETRADTHFAQYMDEANTFRTMSKFPPAFGLMGTTLGMINLLQSLGKTGSQSQIGPMMAVGLVATLYGIALSNFVLIPISENLTKQTKEDRLARRMVVEGVMLIYAEMPVTFIREKVLSYLLPSQRRMIGTLVGDGKAQRTKRGRGRQAA